MVLGHLGWPEVFLYLGAMITFIVLAGFVLAVHLYKIERDN